MDDEMQEKKRYCIVRENFGEHLPKRKNRF